MSVTFEKPEYRWWLGNVRHASSAIGGIFAPSFTPGHVRYVDLYDFQSVGYDRQWRVIDDRAATYDPRQPSSGTWRAASRRAP